MIACVAEYTLSDGTTSRVPIESRSLKIAARAAQKRTPDGADCVGLFIPDAEYPDEYHIAALLSDGQWWWPAAPFGTLRNLFTGETYTNRKCFG